MMKTNFSRYMMLTALTGIIAIKAQNSSGLESHSDVASDAAKRDMPSLLWGIGTHYEREIFDWNPSCSWDSWDHQSVSVIDAKTQTLTPLFRLPFSGTIRACGDSQWFFSPRTGEMKDKEGNPFVVLWQFDMAKARLIAHEVRVPKEWLCTVYPKKNAMPLEISEYGPGVVVEEDGAFVWYTGVPETCLFWLSDKSPPERKHKTRYRAVLGKGGETAWGKPCVLAKAWPVYDGNPAYDEKRTNPSSWPSDLRFGLDKKTLTLKCWTWAWDKWSGKDGKRWVGIPIKGPSNFKQLLGGTADIGVGHSGNFLVGNGVVLTLQKNANEKDEEHLWRYTHQIWYDKKNDAWSDMPLLTDAKLNRMSCVLDNTFVAWPEKSPEPAARFVYRPESKTYLKLAAKPDSIPLRAFKDGILFLEDKERSLALRRYDGTLRFVAKFPPYDHLFVKDGPSSPVDLSKEKVLEGVPPHLRHKIVWLGGNNHTLKTSIPSQPSTPPNTGTSSHAP